MDLLLCLLPTGTVRDVLLEHGRQRGMSFGRLHTNPFCDDLIAALFHRLRQETAGDDPLGALFVGLAPHTPQDCVLAAAKSAEGAGADVLISVGGGSSGVWRVCAP